jgi:hypothetical protein
MDGVPPSWYERNKTQVKLLQFLVYHLRKEGVVIAPKPPRTESKPVPTVLPGKIMHFD